MLCRLLGSLPGPTSISNVSKERGNFLLQPRHHIRVSRMATLVGWSPSSEGWAKLKTDGFVSSKPGRGGTRGPLRDHTGRWLGGFGRVLGETDSLIAGWWALRDGPQLARRMGIQFLEIDQMDAEVLYNLSCKQPYTNLYSLPVISECRSLCREFWYCRARQVFGEAIGAAGIRARFGRDQLAIGHGCSFWEEPPLALSGLAHYCRLHV